MDENMKSIILIGNSTFTFSDGNVHSPNENIEGISQQKNSEQGGEQNGHCMYNQLGYFSQDFTNLTVYLNDTTTLPADKINGQWDGFGLGSAANYPFFPLLNTQLNDGLQYFNLHDAPEYIDINSLMLPGGYQGCFGEHSQISEPKAQSDDEVIYVGEYQSGENIQQGQPKSIPAPRRNPKRQVQLQKGTCDDYYDLKRYGFSEHNVANARRSTRTTGAVYNPPSPLTSNDYREWPVDGMHEKPKFNPTTKKLEKLPKTKQATIIKRKAAKKRTAKEDIAEVNKEFALLAHTTFHHTLCYVRDVKQFNETKGDVDLQKAKDILKDACILYSIANDVDHEALAKYMFSLLEKDDVNEHLASILTEKLA